jgi:signal transduction histidine kinase
MRAVGGVVAAGRDEWRRGYVGWHAGFGALAVLAAVLVASDGGIGPGARVTGLVLLVALCGCYVAVGARALRRESPGAGLAYLLLAAPLTVGLFAVAPVAGLMLGALYPHIWALLPLPRAVAGTVVVVAAVSGVLFGTIGPGSDGVLPALAYGGAALLLALLLGLWITRIIGQSERRAELIAELDATRDELAAVSRETGALAERARVARDVHDTVAQGFASVLLQLAAVEAELGSGQDAARRHLAAARRTAQANLEEARSLIDALTPPDLRAASLPEALHRLAARTRAEFGLAVRVDVTGAARALPASQEVVLFRAAQEALTNAGRHAGARTAALRLAYRDDGVDLLVHDDGRGLADDGPVAGFGLTGMRARITEAGGVLTVDSAPGCGVTLRVELPGPVLEP